MRKRLYMSNRYRCYKNSIYASIKTPIPMKKIALLGTASRIFGDVLNQLLKHSISIDSIVDVPENLKVQDSKLAVSQIAISDIENTLKALEGHDTAVLVYNDDLKDASTNEIALKTFAPIVNGARKAGIKRIIAVGSENSETFFTSMLQRLDDIDWLYISNVGPYARRVCMEIEKADSLKES